MQSAFFRVALVADDHESGPDSQPISVSVNGQGVFFGVPNVPHGAPFGQRFSNWVQLDYPTTLSSAMTLTLANTSPRNAEQAAAPDWLAIDWIELYLNKYYFLSSLQRQMH